MGYKFALLAIFVPLVLYFGCRYTLVYSYQGIVKKKIGDAVGWVAVLIGVYALILAAGLVYMVGYLAVWMLS